MTSSRIALAEFLLEHGIENVVWCNIYVNWSNLDDDIVVKGMKDTGEVDSGTGEAKREYFERRIV